MVGIHEKGKTGVSGESLGVRVFRIVILSWIGENISLVRSH
jgi:hypothetical protein